MPEISLDDTVVLSRDAVFRDLDGEAVILNLRSGTYFGLNRVGTRVWQLLELDGRLRSVFDALCREFDAPPDDIARDLLALVARLTEAQLGELQ